MRKSALALLLAFCAYQSATAQEPAVYQTKESRFTTILLYDTGLADRRVPIQFVNTPSGVVAKVDIRDVSRRGHLFLAVMQLKNGGLQYGTLSCFLFSADSPYADEHFLRTFYPLFSEMASYQAGSFHFGRYSYVLVSVGNNGNTEEATRIARNAFNYAWFWPYLSFPPEPHSDRK